MTHAKVSIDARRPFKQHGKSQRVSHLVRRSQSDSNASEYAVMWLDNTAATNFAADGVGHAKPDGDRIPFIFRDADGSGIHTTFAYDRATDTWSWTIDNVDRSGRASPFATLTLTRKK